MRFDENQGKPLGKKHLVNLATACSERSECSALLSQYTVYELLLALTVFSTFSVFICLSVSFSDYYRTYVHIMDILATLRLISLRVSYSLLVERNLPVGITVANMPLMWFNNRKYLCVKTLN